MNEVSIAVSFFTLSAGKKTSMKFVTLLAIRKVRLRNVYKLSMLGNPIRGLSHPDTQPGNLSSIRNVLMSSILLKPITKNMPFIILA